MNELVSLQQAKIDRMIEGAKSELERYPYHDKTVYSIEPVSAIATDNVVDFMAIRVYFFGNKAPNWFVVRRRVWDKDASFYAYKQDSKKAALELVNRWANIDKYVDDDHYCQVIQFPKAS